MQQQPATVQVKDNTKIRAHKSMVGADIRPRRSSLVPDQQESSMFKKHKVKVHFVFCPCPVSLCVSWRALCMPLALCCVCWRVFCVCLALCSNTAIIGWMPIATMLFVLWHKFCYVV